jgi:hypothetical protein
MFRYRRAPLKVNASAPAVSCAKSIEAANRGSEGLRQLAMREVA